MAMKEKCVYLLGCGPGSAEYVTPIVSGLVRQCTLLVGCNRTLALFPESRAERVVHDGNLQDLLLLVEQRLEQPDRIAWLCTGDTGIRSVAATVQNYLGHNRCIVIPGVSSVQVACARLGIDWSELRVISAHGVVPAFNPTDFTKYHYAILAGSQDALAAVRDIARTLVHTHRLFVCRELSLPEEIIEEIEPDNLSDCISHPRTTFFWIVHDGKKRA